MESWALAASLGFAILAPAFAGRRAKSTASWPYRVANAMASSVAGVWIVALWLLPGGGWPSAIRIVGCAILALGIALAWWARRCLASAFARTVSTPQRVVTTGPFAWMRHPFYAGCWLALVGSALMVASVVGVLIGLGMLPLLRVLWQEEDAAVSGLPGARAWQAATPAFGLRLRRN